MANTAWGKLLRESETQGSGYSQNLRMQGQYLDRETGLHDNLFRYYDPDCGRFTQQDPIGLAGGINLYQYAPNALGWVDPWGLSRCNTGKKPGPQLPGGIAETFGKSVYKNRQLKRDETFYKYHGVNNRTGRKISWLTNEKYNSEEVLREKLAIRHDWGVNITNVSEFRVPKGTWVSEGPAAAQGAGYPGMG
jgi:RHS repeat-associated protein